VAAIASMTTPQTEIILAFADDEHLMGHRHSEWVCVTPFLEEDLAFASIGQDELGHAVALYQLVGEDVEHLALRRSPDDWRSCWLVEEPCKPWEQALVRHFLYDTAERLRWENLVGLAALSRRALAEEDYHRRHATLLVERLLDGTEESRRRITTALDDLLMLGVAQWEAVASEPAALAEGVIARPSHQLAHDWRAEIEAILGRHGVTPKWPEPDPDLQAGRTRRSAHFDDIHHALTEVVALDPAATW
jgi:ring-1,2-phenylacetyl-CoA epoxidase subunit PaaC